MFAPRIIEAAVKVFAEQGIGKARMDDIAQETGVSKGTLYLYFKSKDAIIRTVGAEFQGMSPLMRGEQGNWGIETWVGLGTLAAYFLPRLAGWWGS